MPGRCVCGHSRERHKDYEGTPGPCDAGLKRGQASDVCGCERFLEE